ncbi:MAG: hypothetical protein CML60_05395 [Rhodobacteraceae bacterium]|nr:hypothetical protein [Paracoccaceae bacterium]MBT25813.1 hypothetical protein [Paracoccaceae bacterium]
MTHASLPPLTDEELIAYFEDALPPQDRAAVQARLELDPAAQAKLADWAQQNADLQALFPAEPVPDRLRALLRASPPEIQPEIQPEPQPGFLSGPRWRALAASLAMLAIGGLGGWLSHAQLAPIPAGEAAQQTLAQAALRAHETYVVEVVHPVEVPASQRAHMDSWMSKRVGAPLSPPNLSQSGYTLMGGRILPAGSNGAAGLYMYEDENGGRITLYVSQGQARDSAFRFAQTPGAQSLMWHDQGLGYALTGAVPRDDLKKLAQSAYDQLL